MSSRPAAGGGRWIDVAPERIVGWLDGFARRHGEPVARLEPDHVAFTAADGAVAECHVPFPPPGDPAPPALAEDALRERLVGVVLVRLGGYAAGVFSADGLVASKVGVRPVHGRNAAGGWSQHRFARRRDKQIREATAAAAAAVAGVLLPYATRLDAVVLGGDRARIAAVGADRRLAGVFALAVPRFLTVPDPRYAVLAATPPLFRAIRVRLREPAGDPDRVRAGRHG